MLDFECTTSKHFISNGKNAATKAKIQNLAENRRLTASGLERASSFDSAALPQRLWTLKDFPFETFILPCFSRLPMVGDPSNITLSTAYPRQNWHDALS